MLGGRILGTKGCFMSSSRGGVLYVAALFLAVWAPASAQSVISTHSGVVHFFDGSVFMGDQPMEQKFGRFPDVAEGAELRTEKGRAEVLLTPGAFLRIGENSAIRMISSQLSDTRVELLAGSAIFESTQYSKDTSVTLIYKNWRVQLPGQGLYRLDAEPPQLRVYQGDAQVAAGDSGNSVQVRSGERLPLAEVLVAENFKDDSGDAFSDWAVRRSQAISSDNSIAAQILDDPSSVDNSSLAFGGGFTYFPMTAIPSLGLGSPYGLSFWSPLQPALATLYTSPLYLPYGYYLGLSPGIRSSTLLPLSRPYPAIGVPSIGIGAHYGIQPGIGASRVSPGIGASAPRVAPHPAAPHAIGHR
jgi:FecR protein